MTYYIITLIIGVYCPQGSSQPTLVGTGYYSLSFIPSDKLDMNGNNGGSYITPYSLLDGVGSMDLKYGRIRSAQALCDRGYYCMNGIRYPCPAGVYGETTGLATAACSGACPMGYYCPESTINKYEFRCPAGRYGSITGLTDSSCSGMCSPGYYCPEQSTNPTQVRCGYKYLRLVPNITNTDTVVMTSEVNKPNGVFCYIGTSMPQPVHSGYYSIGGDKTTRTDETPCPMGSYCQDGVIYDCPAGRYGRAQRLSNPECTGACQKGFYCPVASTTMNEIPCPKGRYGAVEGLGSLLCSGPCLNPYYCPSGSISSTVSNTAKAGNVW